MNTTSMHRISNTGWIKLYRCLLEHPLWLNSTSQQKVVLVTLLLLANHAERKWEWQGRPYTCKPGQLITSLESLRKKCGSRLTVQNVRSALKRFETMGFINRLSNKHNSLITICNWECYQTDNNEANTQINVGAANAQQTANQQLTTNKNDKNIKNERIDTHAQQNHSFVKPTVQEVEAYARSQGYGIDSRHFWDYYESRGWMVGQCRMKDWRAAVRTWNRNQKTYGKKTVLPRVGKEVVNHGNYETVTA